MIDADTLGKKFIAKNQLFPILIIVMLGVLGISIHTLSGQPQYPFAMPNFLTGFVIGVILCFGSQYIFSVIVGTTLVFALTSLVQPFNQILTIDLFGVCAIVITLYVFRKHLTPFASISSVQDLIRSTGFIFVPLSLITPLLFQLFSDSSNSSFTQSLQHFFSYWLSQLNACLLIIPLIMEWRIAQAPLLKSRSIAITLTLSAIVLLLGQIVFFEWFSITIVKPYWLIYFTVSFVLITQSARIILLIPMLITLQIMVSAILKIGFFADDLAQTFFLNANIFIFGYTMAVLCALYFLINNQILWRKLKDTITVLRLKGTALDAISQGVVITDCDKKITYVNQGFRELTLYKDEQLIGNNCNLLQGDDSSATTIHQIHLGLEARKKVHVEILNYKKNGEKFWNEVSISPVFTDGILTQFIGVQQDITWRKQAEDDARMAKMVFEYNRNAITITDSATKIIAVNPMFTVITGYSAEEAIGNTPHILSAGLHDDIFYKEMWRNLNQFGFWEGEVFNKRMNGEIYPQHLVITRVLDSRDQVTNYIGMFRDITQDKQLEEKISDLQENDQLTGIRNLPNLIKLATAYLDACDPQEYRSSKKIATLFLIDIDFFQNINDTLGHHVGDVALIKIAQLLQEISAPDYFLARQGGDEFVFSWQRLMSMKRNNLPNIYFDN
ncbi:PAS domain-containing protein [Undibacterium danionis]|uniref:PAS domain-containing protein n=1 Tax=Undibacterium danionis TaxID=1812100 RepID=A0ABV6IA00_9BURK